MILAAINDENLKILGTFAAPIVVVLGILWILLPAILYDQLRTLRKIERHLKGMANAPVQAPPPPPPTPAPKPVVTAPINCPTCYHPFTVQAGIKTDCPRCGEKVMAEYEYTQIA